MEQFAMFNRIREGASRADKTISNVSALGLSEGTKPLRVLWMYPDVLNLHGGRGDLMALLHYSCLLGLPCEIRRINGFNEDIPLDSADLVWFASADISVMKDVCAALAPRREAFASYAARGGWAAAVASGGAALARRIMWLDGSCSEGLGLLDIDFIQREKAHGDDLLCVTEDGLSVVATQVQMADVILLEGQSPFGRVVYGRGNRGDGMEGARKGNIIYTNGLGPVLTKNPRLAEAILKGSAASSGMDVAGMSLRDEDIALELAAADDVRAFVQKKIDGILK